MKYWCDILAEESNKIGWRKCMKKHFPHVYSWLKEFEENPRVLKSPDIQEVKPLSTRENPVFYLDIVE